MSHITKTEKLFIDWQEKHKNDTHLKDNCTLPEDARINFIHDGRFDETKTGGILFICKESNVGNDTDYGIKDFWMKKVVEAKGKGEYYKPSTANDKRAQTKYYNCLQHIINKINTETGENYKIEDCAYMNINKRGGTSVADNEKIKNYYNQYRQFIKKEIELLECNYIVFFCNEKFEDIIDELKSIENYSGKIYGYSKHPSRYSKSCDVVKAP